MTHRIARFSIVLGSLFAAGAASGCYGNSTAPTTPPFTETMDVFTGVIKPLGTDSHQFTVNYTAAQSDASVKVTSLTSVATGAPANITIGIGFGNTNVGVCAISALANPAATLNTELPTSGAPFVAGPYCVEIYDNPAAPTVTEPLNYSLTVSHF